MLLLWTQCFNTSISFSKKKLAVVWHYHCMYSCMMLVTDPGGGAHAPSPHTQTGREIFLKKNIYILRIICTVMV